MLTLQLAHIDTMQCKDADIVIHPNVDGIGLLSRSVKESRDAMEAGVVATKASIPAIRAKLGAIGVATDSKDLQQ